ncbi:MAG: lipoprotein LpqH [Mycobacterium sp.]
MKSALVLGLTSAAVVASLAGCSAAKDGADHATSTAGSAATSSAVAGSETSAPAGAPATPAAPGAKPGTGHVSLNNADLGAEAAVTCETASGVVTVTIESNPKTTLVVTDEASPAIQTVTIGELGSGPSLAYVNGVSGKVEATRTGSTFTVSGTSTGATADAPDKPIDLPFDIAATCP